MMAVFIAIGRTTTTTRRGTGRCPCRRWIVTGGASTSQYTPGPDDATLGGRFPPGTSQSRELAGQAQVLQQSAPQLQGSVLVGT
jgi:hypothetical protein